MADDKSRGPREEGAKADPEKLRPHQSGSFLVRFWVEPSDVPGEQVLRGCIKNLKTGQEQYVSDPGKIGDLVRGHLKEREQGKAQEAEEESEQTWAGQH